MWLGSFVIFQGSGPVAKENIFCDILEGVLWTPPPPPPYLDPRMAWMQSEAGHYYVWRDLGSNCLHKKSFWKKFSQEHHQWIKTKPDAVQMQIKPNFLCPAWSRSKLFAKVIINFSKGEARRPVKGRQLMIRQQDMYPFLNKIIRYKIYKIQLIRLKIRIRISTSGSRSGPIKFWHCI